MTIAKGRPWGTPGAMPRGAPTVDSDAALAAFARHGRTTGQPMPPAIGLLGGSLWRTLGGPGARGRLQSPDAMWFPIDVGRIDVDGASHWFVAHCVARRGSRWSVAMNSDWWRGYQLGPKAHPNDGLLDVYDADLPWPELLKVRRRARNGGHLPHPGVRERRVPQLDWEFDRPRTLWADGHRIRRKYKKVTLTIEPD